MSTIVIDSAYAQEIVEFWVHKYQQAKEEIDQLKARYPARTFSLVTHSYPTACRMLPHKKNNNPQTNPRRYQS